MDQRDTFDGAADDYAATRPGYPAALFDHLEALGALGPETRALEVGCGAGQATIDLARRAASLVAVDPGPKLVAQARARAEGLPVAFVVSRFEDFEAPPGAFDHVASAQAWHWIPAEIGFPKAARLLRRGGWLTVFGHVHARFADALPAAMAPVLESVLPGAWSRLHPSSGYGPSGPLAGLFAADGLFEPVIHRAFETMVEMSPLQLGRFLRTVSDFHRLAEAERFDAFDHITNALDRMGGAYRSLWETHVYAARRV